MYVKFFFVLVYANSPALRGFFVRHLWQRRKHGKGRSFGFPTWWGAVYGAGIRPTFVGGTAS